ncbi:MAG: DUF4957 domain-containing protein [Rikenellaceae bacterium]|nr:DUF4957 domain-containing protein [Rikenellaceae bacterium]
MNTNIFKYIKTVLGVLLGVFILASCSDDKMEQSEDYDYDYVIKFTGEPVVSKNSISYEWESLGERARTYTVEISRYEDFQVSEVFYPETNSILIDDLRYESTYYTRVRGNLKNGKITVWTQAIPVTTPVEPVDEFITTEFTDATVSENTIRYAWESIEEAEDYTIQVSETSDFWDYISASVTVNAYTFSRELDYNTTYYARVRANLENGLPTQWAYSGPYTTERERAEAITKVEADGIEAIVYFDTEYDLSYIVITKSRSTNPILNIDLTEEDINNGYVVIEEGLSPITSYDAYIYGVFEGEEDYLFNNVGFDTGWVTDFYVPEDQYLSEILNIIPDGYELTLYLPAGYNQNISLGSEISIKGSNVTIKSVDETQRASVYMNVQLGVADNMAKLRFEDVDFTGNPTDFSRFINLGNVNISNFEIVGCTITNVPNGIIGLNNYASPYIAEVLIDNCIFQTAMNTTTVDVRPCDGLIACGDPSTNRVLSAGGDVGKVTVQNSTFIDVTYGLFPLLRTGTEGLTLSNFNAVVKNCTFAGNDRINDTFIRFMGGSVATVEFKNLIFAKLSRTEANGIRPFITVPNSVTNCFRTVDQEDGASFKFSAAGIPVADFTGVDLFPNENNNDFTINPDLYFDGKQVSTWGVGDPRWFPAGVNPAN